MRAGTIVLTGTDFFFHSTTDRPAIHRRTIGPPQLLSTDQGLYCANDVAISVPISVPISVSSSVRTPPYVLRCELVCDVVVCLPPMIICGCVLASCRLFQTLPESTRVVCRHKDNITSWGNGFFVFFSCIFFFSTRIQIQDTQGFPHSGLVLQLHLGIYKNWQEQSFCNCIPNVFDNLKVAKLFWSWAKNYIGWQSRSSSIGKKMYKMFDNCQTPKKSENLKCNLQLVKVRKLA